MAEEMKSCVYLLASGRALSLRLDLEPAAQSWQQQSATSFTDDSGAYLLNWVEEAQPEGGILSKVHLRRADGGEFKIVCAEYKMHFAACGIQKIWPTSRLCYMRGEADWDFDHWGGETYSHASVHDPFVMALTEMGKNVFSMGLTWTAPDTKMKWIPTPGYNESHNRGYDFTFTRPANPETPLITRDYRDGFYLSEAEDDWWHCIRNYALCIDRERNYQPRPLSPWSLSPCYSMAWTLWCEPEKQKWIYEDGNMQRLVESHLQRAKDIGCDIVHLDIDFLKWDNYFSLEEKTRFYDFRALTKRMEEMGMIFEAHFSTPIITVGAPNFEEYRDSIIATKDTPEFVPGGISSETTMRTTCPRTPATAKRLAEAARAMVRDLGIKSIWVDFNDDLCPLETCIAQHEHAHSTLGEGWEASMDALTSAAWEIDPSVTFIARRSIANIHNKPYLTHMCPFDCQYDRAQQRRDAIFIRAFGGAIPYTFHGVWNREDPDHEVALSMAGFCLLSVPVVCADLDEMPAGHLEVVRQWLQFYREHAEDIIFGEFFPLTFCSPSAACLIEKEDRAYISCFETVPGKVKLTNNPKEIFLYNGVDTQLFTALDGVCGTYRVEVLDCYLKPVGETFTVKAENGKLILDINGLPMPSMLHLCKED